MNIFTALCQGRGNLNEENMSAMLGYLLSSTQSHGLDNVFLYKFLNTIADNGNLIDLNELLNSSIKISEEISFEQPYNHNEHRRYVDIEIKIFDESYNNELYRIIIENKIKPSSSSINQLKEEYEAVKSDIKENDGCSNPKVIMIFLTPTGAHDNLSKQYNNLTEDILGNDVKIWMHWADDENTVTDILRNILKEETEVQINPITDYTKHTIKAFIRHIQETNIQYTSPEKVIHETGKIKDLAYARISSGYYRIEQYESQTIKIFNLNTQEYEVAKPILRNVNKEKDLGINLYFSTGNLRNTRSLGKLIIEELKKQNKDDSNK
jgi:hypothetical protein